MASIVGPKGQVVISKEIRDELGIRPGWVAVQRLVGDRVEIRFLPPEHRNSLRGVLSKYARGEAPDADAWAEAREQAWADAARESERTEPLQQ